MKAGVLALQGDFAAHASALGGAAEVRRADEIDALDALVIPGGESTTMLKRWNPAASRAPCAAWLLAAASCSAPARERSCWRSTSRILRSRHGD
jgi:glutamine amidotransferase PdxT